MELFEYDDLVQLIYAAAMGSACWKEVVRRIAGVCRASAALLFTPMHAPAEGGFGHAYNLSADLMAHWETDVIHDDPFVGVMRERGLVVAGTIVRGSELVPDEQLLQSRFYRELWEPAGIGRVCSGVIFDGREMMVPPVALSVYRSFAEQEFVAVEVDAVRGLIAHLSRALRLMFHLRDRSFQVAASTVALERLSVGVVFVQRDGRITYANPAAERVLAHEEWFLLRQTGDGQGAELSIHPRFNPLDCKFKAMLRDACESVVAVDTLRIPDGAEGTACVIHAMSPGLGAAHLRQIEESGCILFLYDLSDVVGIPPARLNALYGLTPAECGVALQAVKGGGAEEMAGRLGISVNTVNTHLRNVFAKTGTHRQADLLKLLLALAVE